MKKLMLCALVAAAAISTSGLVACSTTFRKGIRERLATWRHWLVATFPNLTSSRGVRHVLNYPGLGSIDIRSRMSGVVNHARGVDALPRTAQRTPHLTLSSRAFMSSLVCEAKFAL